MSGDASALGHPDDLALYKTALDVGLAFDAYQRIPPLSAGFAAVVEVPGNHDHWSGYLLNPLVSKTLRPRYFPMNQRASAQLVVGRRTIVFQSLCSTLGATPPEQLAAVGAIDMTELGAVQRAIAAHPRGHDLFLVTHHSPSHGYPWFHGLRPQSHAHLVTLCGNVHGMLTGHTHSTHVEARGVLPPETRSATTLQAGKKKRNGLLVHELVDGGRALEWTATEYLHAGPRFKKTVSWRIT